MNLQEHMDKNYGYPVGLSSGLMDTSLNASSAWMTTGQNMQSSPLSSGSWTDIPFGSQLRGALWTGSPQSLLSPPPNLPGLCGTCGQRKPLISCQEEFTPAWMLTNTQPMNHYMEQFYPPSPKPTPSPLTSPIWEEYLNQDSPMDPPLSQRPVLAQTVQMEQSPPQKRRVMNLLSPQNMNHNNLKVKLENTLPCPSPPPQQPKQPQQSQRILHPLHEKALSRSFFWDDWAEMEADAYTLNDPWYDFLDEESLYM